jgi:PAP2 superfamily protein
MYAARSPTTTARPSPVGELLVVLTLVKVYDRVRALAATRRTQALGNGRDILQVEGHVHLAVERTANLWAAHSPVITLVAATWYQLMHLSVTLLTLAACYWWRPDLYRRARNSLVTINVVGLIVFWLYPVAPPRLLTGAGFVDLDVLAGYGTGPAGPGSPDMYAALPSLHLAWATWSVIVVRHLLPDHPRTRRLVPLYAVTTAAVVIVTGNHYVLDVVSGVAVALIAIGLNGLLDTSTSAPAVARQGRPAPPRAAVEQLGDVRSGARIGPGLTGTSRAEVGFVDVEAVGVGDRQDVQDALPAGDPTGAGRRSWSSPELLGRDVSATTDRGAEPASGR